jgi:hypothetical protein
MKQQSQFHSGEQEAQKAREQAQPLEFATAEELLRHDALQTPVPPAIAERLQESVSHLPAPKRPWWRRLLGL